MYKFTLNYINTTESELQSQIDIINAYPMSDSVKETLIEEARNNATINYEVIYPPIGWEDIQLAFSRSDLFGGVFRKWTAGIKFVKEDKTLIENLIDLRGLNFTINIEIELYNDLLSKYETIFTGIANLSDYKIEQDSVQLSFEDGSMQQALINAAKTKLKIGGEYNLNGVKTYSPTYETITIKGIAANTTSYAIYPDELFRFLLSAIGIEPWRFKSEYFQRVATGAYYNGKGAHRMIVKGDWLRGYTHTESGVSTSFNDLFTSFKNIFGLHAGFETDQISGITYLRVEPYEYFWEKNTMFTLDYVAELSKEIDMDLHPKSITVGYNKFEEDNDLGQVEYNAKTQYTLPYKAFEKDMPMLSIYRADATGIEKLRNTPKDTDPNKSKKEDNEIFIISINLETKQSIANDVDYFESISNIYGASPLYINCDMTPARSAIRWSPFYMAGLMRSDDRAKYLNIQSSERKSSIITRLATDTFYIYDNKDIRLTDLQAPFFTGYKLKFTAPVTNEIIQYLTYNQYGLVKFWDYFKNRYSFGFLIECSTEPIDKSTNWELREVAYYDEVPIEEEPNYLLLENGNYLLLENKGLILLEQ